MSCVQKVGGVSRTVVARLVDGRLVQRKTERGFMSTSMSRVVMAAAFVCVTAAGGFAQETTSTNETKAFEVLAVEGDVLVVRLPEGTRELKVPADFRFMVNGQPLSVGELKAGMKGTATITTRTTATPVTVTEVKSGTVVQKTSDTLVVRIGETKDVKRFNIPELDRRGIQVMRDGRPAKPSDLREGDKLSATIITTRPPQILTEREVQATLAADRPAPSAAPAPAPAPPPPPAQAAVEPEPAPAATSGRTLPSTASSWPAVGLGGALMLALGLTLMARRRLFD